MALAFNDRVQQTGTANTTVSFTLSGSVTGFQSFAVIGNGNTTYYSATDNSGNWEVGVGTYSTTGPTLTRTTILSSSNSNTAVTFSGAVNVFVTYPAENAVTTDTLAYPPAIGGTTPAAGKFTTFESTGTASLGTGSTTYIRAIGDANYPGIYVTGGTNTPLVLQPLGTGALQAQKTDSTSTGGNARGANAVDWQTIRDAGQKVASGAYSVITGGYGNQSTGQYAINLGGSFNNSNGTYTGIYGGSNNLASLPYAVVINGSGNTAAGYYNFIGAGFTNSGTSSSAVTTQSGTMNATTAVTLSASNANIKVGQYITGTSIAGDTYVAAISGTSLTLSKNASGSSTSTLSFYTPHGVVVGGGNNQATGAYSFIGGGGDAGTAANRNTASGDWSAIMGGRGGTTRGITGYHVFPACSVPIASGAGYSQSGLLVLGKQTTDATATVITSDGGSATTSNQVVLPNNSAYYFRGEVVAGVTGGGNTKGWTIEGVIKRGSGVGTAAIVGTPVLNVIAQDSGASTWTIAITADTTNGGLSITVTGQASTTIRWVAQIRTTEMTY